MPKSRKIGNKTRKHNKRGSGTGPSKMVPKVENETPDDIESGLGSREPSRSNTPSLSMDSYDPELGEVVSASSSRSSSRATSPLNFFASYLKKAPSSSSDKIAQKYNDELQREVKRTNEAFEWNKEFDESAKLELEEQARKLEEEVKKRKEEEEMKNMYQADIDSTIKSQTRNAEESKRNESLCERISVLREKGWNQFSSMVDDWCNENESKKNRGGRKKNKMSKKRRHKRRKVTRRK